MRAESSLLDQPEEMTSGDTPFTSQVFRQITAGILREGKTLRFTAYGNSMHPQIQHGDVITVTPLARVPRVDEVIMLVCDPDTAKVMVHRVTATTASTVTTKGDSCPTQDGDFPHSAILGAVTRVERGGNAVKWNKPWWPPGIVGRFVNLLRRVYHRVKRIRI